MVELLQSPNYNLKQKDTPDLYFTGNTSVHRRGAGDPGAHRGPGFSINVISKSGTTTEPAIAFRIFRAALEKKYGKAGGSPAHLRHHGPGKGGAEDPGGRGGARDLCGARRRGGRCSVLTAVGLLPIAVSGVDITALMEGAADAP